jgi:uncharacterized repeat protein (TIGR03847 family)
MADAKNEFTSVSSIKPESIGEPGKRTFRIVVNSASSSAAIWLEKEQLFQLGLAIQQIVANLPTERGTTGSPPTQSEASPLTRLDFKVVKMFMNYDKAKRLFIIDAHDSDDDEATVRVWVDEQQINEFAQEALKLCAAGRPICPLCARPMDPEGHHCARTNGFVKLTPEELSEDV